MLLRVVKKISCENAVVMTPCKMGKGSWQNKVFLFQNLIGGNYLGYFKCLLFVLKTMLLEVGYSFGVFRSSHNSVYFVFAQAPKERERERERERRYSALSVHLRLN